MAETSVTLTDSEIKKDSRQSWFVCVAASLLVGFSMVINNSFGVLFVNMVDEFDGGRAKIGKSIQYNTIQTYISPGFWSWISPGLHVVLDFSRNLVLYISPGF